MTTDANRSDDNGYLKAIQSKIPRIGVFLAILGCALFSLSEACAKLIALTISAEMILCFRYLIHSFVTAPFLFKSTEKLPAVTKSDWCYSIIGGIICGAATFVCNYAYHYIPLLDALVLSNAQPIFAAIIAWLWLKEKLTFYEIGVIIITLIGVVIACQPTFIFGTGLDAVDSESRALGSIFSLLCALCSALITTITRKAKNTPTQLTVYLQGVGGTFLGFVSGVATGNLYLSSNLSTTHILALVFAGVLGFIARSCFAFAVQTEEATLIAVLQTLEIPMSFVMQIIMLATYPNSLSVIGGLIVMIGTVLLATKKHVKNQAKNLKQSFKNKIKPIIAKTNGNKTGLLKSREKEEKVPLIIDRNRFYG